MSNRFLESHGFTDSPFASTNADNEPTLSEYFIPPPYFHSVMGNPTAPQSQIVFAPRGGGKSAQRRMIEDRARTQSNFMCVSYDNFDQPAGFKSKDATLSYHLNQVCRLILVAILIDLEDRPSNSDCLSPKDKTLLKVQLDHFVGSLSSEQFQAAIASIKTLGDKAREFLKKYAGPIGVALEVIKRKWGLDIDVPQSEEPIAPQDATIRFHLTRLVEILNKLGYSSCYILVDKVDEASITSVADKTFDLIAPLISDLPTLEISGIAYKFFLWDAIEDLYDSSGFARRDRIPVYKLDWGHDELAEMLSSRMSAFSNQETSSFNRMIEGDDFDVHRLVTLLAAGSPRNMIRLAQRIVAAATRSGDELDLIPMAAVWTGVRSYSEEVAGELFSAYMPDLRRVGTPTFTTKFLGNEIFRVHDNAVRRKLQLWQSTGVVARTGEIPNPGNRPLHQYGVIDPRVCVAAFHQDDPELVLGNYTFVCDACKAVCISDQREFTCQKCGNGHDLASAVSVISYCTRPGA